MRSPLHYLVGAFSALTFGLLVAAAAKIDAPWLALAFGVLAGGNVIVAWEGAKE